MKNNNLFSRLKTPFIIPAVAGLSTLLAPSAGAVEAILAVDSYVSASQPATNFGKAGALPVGNGNRALLRFDLASMLPAGTTAGQVSKAVLQVWVSGVTKSGSVAVSELLGSWTEPGVTEATLPGAGPAFATKAVSTAGRWVSIVVTSQVKKWLSTPSANNGLLIAPAASAPATAVSLDSKENTATSHPARLEIVLAGTLGGSYTLVVGKTSGDNTGRSQLAVPDFTTITAALNKIPNVYSNGACSARYLIRVLPGVYSERVTMKPCVDIEGSGELTTKITAAGGANWDSASATLAGASEAELRFLTVENTGGAVYAIGIYNNGASPRLTHVTATAKGGSYYSAGVNNANASPAMTHVTAAATGGGSFSFGVDNRDGSSPTMTNIAATGSGSTSNVGVQNIDNSKPMMTNVTATGSGGTTSAGVYNYNSSSPTMKEVTATASGGADKNYGVYNYYSAPPMANVTATASGGNFSFGIYNDSSSPAMMDVTATASGNNSYGVSNNNSSSPTMTNINATAAATALDSCGVANYSSSPAMMNVTATATNTGSGVAAGVYSYLSAPTMTNVTATGSGGNSYGVRNYTSSPTMENVTATASGGYFAYGVENEQSSSSTIHRSTLRGTTYSIHTVNSAIRVGGSQLNGNVYNSNSTIACVASYNANFVALNAACVP
jgi:hypothetical protein